MTRAISPEAAARRDAHRRHGRFGNQPAEESGLVAEPTSRVTLEPAPAQTQGSVFRALPAPEDHVCKAACYRVSKDRSIYTLCEYGHMVSYHDGKSSFAGSWFEASLSSLPAFAPFNLVPAGEQ